MTSRFEMWPNVSGQEGSPYGVRATLRCLTSRLASWVRPLPPMMASIGSALLHRPDLGQVAPEALRVHAAAEDEAVGNLQADEVGVDRLLLVEDLLDQHRAVHRLRAELEQPRTDRGHRFTVIEDVVDHQYRAALRQGRRRYAPLDAAAARRLAVARGVDVVEVERKLEHRQQLPG